MTEPRVTKGTASPADLCTGYGVGARRVDLYLDRIAAAGLELQSVHENSGHRYATERSPRTCHGRRARSVSLLAKPPEHSTNTATDSRKERMP